MSSTLNTFVPVLDGTNYQQWAAAMQSFLMSQGQWRVIIKYAPIPKYEDATPVEPIKKDDGTINVNATKHTQKAADEAVSLTDATNQAALHWGRRAIYPVGTL